MEEGRRGKREGGRVKGWKKEEGRRKKGFYGINAVQEVRTECGRTDCVVPCTALGALRGTRQVVILI